LLGELNVFTQPQIYAAGIFCGVIVPAINVVLGKNMAYH
tara:strand:- start:3212 stop:3328 length:117 start_codon:yes stop_codon:yes gene_type:complete